jgi:polyferredoxin
MGEEKAGAGRRKGTDVRVTARRLSQAAFLLLFLALLVKTDYGGTNELAYPVKVFLDADLLVLASSFLSAHRLPAALFLALLFVPVTILFGRAFCGWLCPFGTLHHAVSYAGRPAVRERGVKTDGARWKFLVLLLFLGSSLFGLQLAGLLDPISFLVRSLSLSVLPAVNGALRAAMEWGYALPYRPVSDLFDSAYTFLSAHFLSFRPPRFQQGLLFLALLVLLLWLDRVRTRFFCRFACPLGALLGLLSRLGVMRLSMNEKCTRCMRCRDACAGGANPHVRDGWSPSECLACMNCTGVCPEDALHWSFGNPLATTGRPGTDRLDLPRRQLLASVAVGASAAWVLRSSPVSARPLPSLVRPPGSTPEGEFLSRCVRCGECMKVCITGGLQPTLLQAGIEGIWTPVLVPPIGYCEFNCTLCGQVCPTGAIRRLSLEEKHRTFIGLAFVDPSRCIPHAFGTPCIVCEEHCPTPKKAIEFVEKAGKGGKAVKVPVVLPELCIGCGICENKCPVVDLAGIRVTSVNEGRNPANRLGIPPRGDVPGYGGGAPGGAPADPYAPSGGGAPGGGGADPYGS